MENVLGNLPGEIQWNIIKYMRHPVADVFLRVSNNYAWNEQSVKHSLLVGSSASGL